MRKLVLKMSMSVDGFVGGPGGEVAPILASYDPLATAWTVATVQAAGLHIMGRRTFHDMVAWWPTSTEPYAPGMNRIPKAVFSRSGRVWENVDLTTAIRDTTRMREERGMATATADPEVIAGWRNARIASGDMVEEIAAMKAEDGAYILAHGGAGFVQSLVATGLIDEYRLLVHPVALGAGLPLFPPAFRPQPLELVGSEAFPGGVVAQVYRPRG